VRENLREEDHHESTQPDTTGTQPQDAAAACREVVRTSERRDDTSETTHAREHTSRGSTVDSVEELRSGGVQDSVEEGLHDVFEGIETDVLFQHVSQGAS